MILDEFLAEEDAAVWEYDPTEQVFSNDIMEESAAEDALISGEDDMDDIDFMQVDGSDTGKSAD